MSMGLGMEFEVPFGLKNEEFELTWSDRDEELRQREPAQTTRDIGVPREHWR